MICLLSIDPWFISLHQVSNLYILLYNFLKKHERNFLNFFVGLLQPLPNIMRGIRDSLVSYLSCTLGNDVLAAQCLLLHLLSKVHLPQSLFFFQLFILEWTSFRPCKQRKISKFGRNCKFASVPFRPTFCNLNELCCFCFGLSFAKSGITLNCSFLYLFVRQIGLH